MALINNPSCFAGNQFAVVKKKGKDLKEGDECLDITGGFLVNKESLANIKNKGADAVFYVKVPPISQDKIVAIILSELKNSDNEDLPEGVAKRIVSAIEPYLKEQEGWVDVEDRMPERGKIVNLYFPLYNNICSGYWDGYGKWMNVPSSVSGICTHWRNLPPAPNQ